MAVQFTYTDPNTGEVTSQLYGRATGITLDFLNPAMSTVRLSAYSTAAFAAAGKNPKYSWQILLSKIVPGVNGSPATHDLTDLNTIFGVPIPQQGLAAGAMYNNIQARVYQWLKLPSTAERLGFDLSTAQDV